MNILPVLDIRGEEVVHAVAGKRACYEPITSSLTPSCDPSMVAHAIRDSLGLDRLYIADLNSLQGTGPPSWSLYQSLARDGFRLLVDAGVTDIAVATQLVDCGVEEAVVALETLPQPAVLEQVVQALGADRVVFSLDLDAGRPRTRVSDWQTLEPIDVAARAIACGVRRLILLDLARVGTSEGWSLGDLSQLLVESHPNLEILTGGGIRSADDLRVLDAAGVSAALVATAIHSGVIGRKEVEWAQGLT